MVIRPWEWKFMEFSSLQVPILFCLYHIIEILRVLQKSGREYYDSLYLKCYIKSYSLYWYHAVENTAHQNSGIHCIFDGIAPTHVQVMILNISDLWDIQWYTTQHYQYWYHAAENIANQKEFIVYLIVLCPLLLLCTVILFLPKSSMQCRF